MLSLEKPETLLMPVPLKIPSISDALLESLSSRIKPVVTLENGMFYIEDVDPRYVAFTMDPTYTAEAKDLMLVGELLTFHTYGAPSFFKPTIAEVLAQIPAGYTDVVTAFETVPNRDLLHNWSDWDSTALDWGYHLGRTTLYGPAS